MISEVNQPPDVNPALTTIEYTLKVSSGLLVSVYFDRPFSLHKPPFQKVSTLPPIFLFAVDTCLSGTELKALKESIQKQLATLPAEAFVGLLTFGRTVELRELDPKNLGRSYVFSVRPLLCLRVYKYQK